MNSTDGTPPLENRGDVKMAGGLITAIVFWVMPTLLILCMYILTPSYVLPFINNPIGRLLLIIVSVCHTLWCGLLAASSVCRWNSVVTILSGLLAGLTLLMLIGMDCMGPAVLTIFQALGPVFGSK